MRDSHLDITYNSDVLPTRHKGICALEKICWRGTVQGPEGSPEGSCDVLFEFNYGCSSAILEE